MRTERISGVSAHRMINSWTYGQYMKSFIDPGNTLRLLKASNDNRGLVTIDEERDYQFSSYFPPTLYFPPFGVMRAT